MNQHAHILCNPYFTAYFTLPSNDRLSVIEVLSNAKLQFIINEKTYELMEKWGISKIRLKEIRSLNISSKIMTKEEIDTIIESAFPKEGSNKKSKKLVRDAAATIAYQELCNKTQILMTDNAFQFQRLTEYQVLCWIHEGRLYKKLVPFNATNRLILEEYLKEFWVYYRRLLSYKKLPKKREAKKLSKDFDVLFSRKTGYRLLDERIADSPSVKMH